MAPERRGRVEVNALLLLGLCACGSDGATVPGLRSDTDAPGAVEAGLGDLDGGTGRADSKSDGVQAVDAGSELEPGGSDPSETAHSLSPLADDDPILVADSDAGPLHCERELSFEAVELSEPEPFDVVIVADHSDSISWSRDDLASGLSALLDEIYGHDARFFVLTPTQYGASAAAALDYSTGSQLVLWRDPTSGQVYDHEVTRYSQSCSDQFGLDRPCPAYPATNEAFAVDGQFQFLMPEPISAISREMDAVELEAQKQTLVDAIVNLGGHAAQTEQPACTLNRYIQQPRQELPQHAVFVIISDEDDTSAPSDCLESYQYAYGPYVGEHETGGCTTDCDLWRSVVWRTTVSDHTNFQCVPADDFGTLYPAQAHADHYSGATLKSCDGFDPTCAPGHLEQAAERCGPGHVVQECARSCDPNGSRPGCSVDLTDPNVDACSQPFENEGAQYANLVDYCEQRTGVSGWGECERGGLTLEQSTVWSTTYAKNSVVPTAADVLDMIRSFRVSATNAFGEDGFYVATIAFDPSFECTLAEGQSYATTLRMASEGPQDLFPICESYAPVLSKVTGFAETLLPTDYGFELGTNESIESVTVHDREGQERQLDAGQFSYDADALNLHVEASALNASDVSLSVTLVDPCARRVH